MDGKFLQRAVWLLPLMLFVHQIEEYFTDFPVWYSSLLGVALSETEWIYLNAFGLLVIASTTLTHLINRSTFPLLMIATLLFVNGVAHCLISIVTFSYSPGTVTGLVLLLPYGNLVYRKAYLSLSSSDRVLATLLGVVLLVVFSATAMVL